MTRTWMNAALMATIVTSLMAAPTAQAVELPATPTITDLSVVTPVVQDGEEVQLAWIGDDGGVGLFVVKATFRDFDWGVHEVVDGAGDTPTTGVMRAAVDASWASGPAVPIKLETFDIGGDGRVYHADDARTPENEARVTVWQDGQMVDTEYGGPDLFGDVVVNIREELTDTEAPRFESLSTAETTVLPGDDLTLSWSGVDDHTGIRGIRVQFRDSDGFLSEVAEEYVDGIPPTNGQILLPVPARATEGIYEVMRVSVFDNACNERFYLLSGPDAQPVSATGDCGLGTFDPDTESPDEPSIVPLAAGVVMARPPMEVPVAPTDVTVAASSRLWTVSWKSTSAWNNQDTLQFYDWLYQVELDGDIVGYSWPETEFVLDGDWVSPGEHTLRIRAVNRFGPGAWSSPVTFSTEPSGVVTDVVAVGRLWGARMTWTAPTTPEAAASYVVTRRFGIHSLDVVPGADSGVGLTTPASQFEALDLEPGRNYTFAVFPVDGQGQVGPGEVTHLSGTRTRVREADLRPGHEVVIRGSVVNRAGSGVPGARVLIQQAPASDPITFTTTAVVSSRTETDGTYRMMLTPRSGFVYRVATPGGVGFGPSWSDTLG